MQTTSRVQLWNRVLFCAIVYMAASVGGSRPAFGQTTPPSTGELKVASVYLARGGCQPAELHVNAGAIILRVVNVSHKRDIHMNLHRDGGSVMGTNQFAEGASRWLQNVTLAPGKYVLEGTNSPEHQCVIVVQ